MYVWIGEQLFQSLLIGQRIEQLLVLQRGGIERLLLLRRQRIGCKSPQQFFEIVFRHIPRTT